MSLHRLQNALVVGVCIPLALANGRLCHGEADPGLLQQVLDGIKRNELAIRNIDANFEIIFEESKEAKPTGFTGVLADVPPERRIAREEYHLIRDRSEGLDRIYAEDRTYRVNGSTDLVLWCYDGTLQRTYVPDRKEGQIALTKRWPTCDGIDRFTNLYVEEMLMSQFLAKCKIEAVRQELVDGHPAILLEVEHFASSPEAPGKMKIRFDPERGYAPVKIETFRLDLSKTQPVLATEVLQFKEVEKGLFLPVDARIISYDKGDDGSMFERSANHLVVHDVRANVDIPPETFTMEYPVGTNVFDERLGHAFTVQVTQAAAAEMGQFLQAELGGRNALPNGDRVPQTQPAELGGQAASATSHRPAGSGGLGILPGGITGWTTAGIAVLVACGVWILVRRALAARKSSEGGASAH